MPDPAPEIIMAANGVYWRRYEEDCPSCWGGRPKWAGTMPAPPCRACHGVGRRVHLSMVPTSTDNDPVIGPLAVYRLVGYEDHEGALTPLPEARSEVDRLRAALEALAERHHTSIKASRLHDPHNLDWRECPAKSCTAARSALDRHALDEDQGPS